MADDRTPEEAASERAQEAAGGAYTVLARKYRPSHFGELIGQEPMVRTLRNAFTQDRIAQAWMLTGVRGVGKTTTARILARALNYEREGTPPHPTVDFDAPGLHCQAIMEGRHVDVIEMDAASHTGINDIREITDAARYKPVSARFKVYIIDEIHMLSTAAFNGLLKTLEEPPAHVKFIFATTEIRKVPVTVLSRCQRFDLRRIETEVLTAHLASVAERENLEAEPEALTMIARAAEGSVRDALSLMDQAIAHGAGAITASGLKDMLGLADRTRVVDLFECVMAGNAAGALNELAAQYDVGADPHVVLSELSNFVHQVTRQKVTNAPPEPGEPEAVRIRSAEFAKGLGMAALSRLWQALLAGINEVQSAPKPMAAAEMVLIRLCYLASLPEPDRLPLTEAASAEGGRGPSAPRSGGTGARGGPVSTAHHAPVAAAPSSVQTPSKPSAAYAAAAQAPQPSPPPPPMPKSLEDVAKLMSGNVRLKHAVERSMRLKRFEPGRIEVSLAEGVAPDIVGALGQKLTELTKTRWLVSVSDGGDTPTIHEQFTAEQDALKAKVRDEPIVKAILDQFEDAEITAVRQRQTAADGTHSASAGGGHETKGKEGRWTSSK
ncbi:MAG: DNA polymerase III subunit gamma/tau [Pseudomonadota bacterium]